MASSSSSASTPTSSEGSGNGGTSTNSPPPPIPKRNVPQSSSTPQSHSLRSPSPSSSSPKCDEEKSITGDYYEGWYDEIRFSSYRTAAKLRALQHRTGLVHIDIWNMIEAFRDNGLNTMETRAAVKRAKLETLVVSLYNSLSKRLPPSANSASNLKTMASWLFSWILTAFSSGSSSKEETSLRVRTLKTLLATLCSGKLMDKLRYIFSQLADANGHLVHSRFRQFLKDVGKIPSSVGETDSSEKNDVTIFDDGDKITVNDFLETMMSDPGPQCLSWLLVLHRISNAESSKHNVTCGSCRKQNFLGLRYKSEQSNYHLCQSCFWRGKIGSKHKEDVFKEYNTYKAGSSTPTGGSGSSASKKGSLNCLPEKSGRKSSQRFPEREKTMDLSNMIPASPQPSMHQSNGYIDRPSSRYSSSRSEILHPYDDPYQQRHPSDGRESAGGMQIVDEEHQLIARYAKQLARQEQQMMAMESIDPNSAGRHALIHSRQLVKDLEKKNREIMRNIHQLREQSKQQQQRFGHLGSAAGQASGDPNLYLELEELRVHKEDLEARLSELQNTRKDLMLELQELMKLLKVDSHGNPPTGLPLGSAPGHPGMLGPPGPSEPLLSNSVTDVSGLGLESGTSQHLFTPVVRPQQPIRPGYVGHQKLLPMVYINNDGSMMVDESSYQSGVNQPKQHYRGQVDQKMIHRYEKGRNDQNVDSPGSMSD